MFHPEVVGFECFDMTVGKEDVCMIAVAKVDKAIAEFFGALFFEIESGFTLCVVIDFH